MLWADFRTLVTTHLHAYARTHGAESLIAANIKCGVEDLQSAVPDLRRRTVVIPATSLTVSGEASFFTIPSGSVVSDLYARGATDHSKRLRYTSTDEKNLPMLKDGTFNMDDRYCIYAPTTGEIWVSPNPSEEGSEVCVTYSRIYSGYADSDDTPLGNSEAEAVGNYVLMKLALILDHNPQEASAYQQLYRGLKRQIMSDHNEASTSAANI